MPFSLEQGISIITVFFQGIISFFSPCTLPLIPLYISYLAGGSKYTDSDGKIIYPRKKIFINTICFVLGISFTFFLLGFSFSMLGQFFNKYKYVFMIISGLIMIIFGLYQFGIFKRRNIIESEHRLPFNIGKFAMNPLTAFVLGFTFSFAWTPCIGPVLSSVLLMVSASDSKLIGFLLIGVYTLGFIIPFLLVGLFTGTVLDLFKRHQNIVKYTVKIGAVLLILMGIMTITGFMNGINSYIASVTNTSSSEKQTENNNSAENNITYQTPNPEITPAPTKKPKKNTSLAPDFELTDQYGQTHKLSDYKGKIVFINFWATWCGYCKEEMPDIEKLYHEYGENSQDVIILGAANPRSEKYPNNSDVSQEEIQEFLDEYNLTFPVLMDKTGDVFKSYSIMSLPTTFIINRDGSVFGYIPGAMSADNMKDAISKAMQ